MDTRTLANHGALEAVVLDLDGTLVDSAQDLAVAVNLVLAEIGMKPLALRQAQALLGKGADHLMRSALQQSHQDATGEALGPDQAERLFARARPAFQEHYGAVNGSYASVYPGVFEALDALQSRAWPLACLTNKPSAFVPPLLRAMGLADYFSEVYGGDAFPRLKPHPLPLEKTCQALGKTPAQVLMVGDSGNDAQAARAAGCAVVLVTYGYNHGRPVTDEDADGYLDSLAQLPAWLGLA